MTLRFLKSKSMKRFHNKKKGRRRDDVCGVTVGGGVCEEEPGEVSRFECCELGFFF